MPERLADRQEYARMEAPGGNRYSDGEILGCHEHGDDEHYSNPIAKRCRRIDEEPDAFAAGGNELLELLGPEDIALDQVAPIAGRALRQVRHLQDVGQDVI